MMAASVAEKPVSFTGDIQPLFNKNCVSCHGGVKKAGKISFLFREDAMSKGKSGNFPIVPGKPDESFLLTRLTDKSDPMPPEEHGPMLPAKDVDLFRRWIAQGAKWQGHWAFEKPVRPALPKVKNSRWVREDLDRFILARLESEKLAPEQEQDRARLIRRVSLDLTGLPPTPEEVAAFVHDKSPKAYEKVVDRLLQSEHFGERWAAMWLDLVRYADSKGLGQDANREIWKYRDWVIEAFNRDLPFDQFTIKQLAGDLLPNATIEDRVASACQRNTQTNDEGGTDDEEFRIEAVIDRVNTTWQAWQGVSFGCVQCHSHPYDPFHHEDYYSFVALFNQTRDVDTRPDFPLMRVPLAREDYARAESLDREIASLKTALHQPAVILANDKNAWAPLVEIKPTADKCGVAVEQRDGREEFHLTGTVARNTRITVEAPVPAGLKQLTALRIDGLPLDIEKAKQLTEWGFVLSDLKVFIVPADGTNGVAVSLAQVFSDEVDPFLDPQDSIDAAPAGTSDEKEKTSSRRGRTGGFAAFTRIDRARWGIFVTRTPVDVSAGSRVKIEMAFNQEAQDAFPLVMRRGYFAVSGDARWAQLVDGPDAVKARADLASKVKERADIRSVSLPVTEELPLSLRRQTQMFIRGNWMTRGPGVQPRTPLTFPPLVGNRAPDRLAVAQWLVGPENPLTARVLVNRLWEQLFGTGIVETLEDFGSAGEKPSHPELLDWLAIRLRDDHKWSVKAMLRELVLSSTYRQDSHISPDKLARDPNNRLLSRGPRLRLSAEMMRDQALALSGLLSPKLFGPPVFPPIPEGVWNPFLGNEKWPTPGPDNPERYRRAVYTHVKRTIPYPMASTFDAPSRELCTQRRILSNTPVQALALLNDTVFHEAAVALATRMNKIAAAPEERIRSGYQLVMGRPPDNATTARLQKLYDQTVATTHDVSAGWQNVATVLLNLDEVLTK